LKNKKTAECGENEVIEVAERRKSVVCSGRSRFTTGRNIAISPTTDTRELLRSSTHLCSSLISIFARDRGGRAFNFDESQVVI